MRKIRNDKGENRINTRTKYVLYSAFSLIAGLAYGYSQIPVETKIFFKNIEVPYEVVKEVPIQEFITLPCNHITKDAS